MVRTRSQTVAVAVVAERLPLAEVTMEVTNRRKRKLPERSRARPVAVREPLGGLEARGARRLRSASPEPCADSPPIARARLEPAAESRRAYAIDDRTEGDELAVVDYVDGLYEYYRDVEVATAKRVDMYMDFQLDITPKMRSILVDWLIEVHTKFKMTQPTIYLTVHIIDRYLSTKQIERSKLQLLGVTALFIASKYEEIYPPELADCTHITDDAYKADEILAMEMTVLRELDWNVVSPNPHFWLVRMMRIVDAQEVTAHRAEYFAQRMLQEYEGLTFRPSLVASAAAHLALRHDRGVDASWPSTLRNLTGYAEDELFTCCQNISFHVNRAPTENGKEPKLDSCAKKFNAAAFNRVARDKCPVLTRAADPVTPPNVLRH